MNWDFYFSNLNCKLIEEVIQHKNLSLANGKIGVIIYLYYIAKTQSKRQLLVLANRLLYELLNEINTVKHININSGLAGIGLSIDYLISNNYIKRNVNSVLNDVDDFLFQILTQSQDFMHYGRNFKVELLYYFVIRLKHQPKGSDGEYLIRELIIDTLNQVYVEMDDCIFTETLIFKMDNPLFLFLISLGEILYYEFYTERVCKILYEISYKLLSLFPIYHYNRLLLLYALRNICKHINIEAFTIHQKLLADSICYSKIANNELKGKDIYYNSGLSGIICLAKQIDNYPLSNLYYDFRLLYLKKIKESGELDRLLSDDDYFQSKFGFFDGYCGLAFSYYFNELHLL